MSRRITMGPHRSIWRWLLPLLLFLIGLLVGYCGKPCPICAECPACPECPEGPQATVRKRTPVKRVNPAEYNKKVYITRTGNKYHDPHHYKDHSTRELSVGEALRQGYVPCGSCNVPHLPIPSGYE